MSFPAALPFKNSHVLTRNGGLDGPMRLRSFLIWRPAGGRTHHFLRLPVDIATLHYPFIA